MQRLRAPTAVSDMMAPMMLRCFISLPVNEWQLSWLISSMHASVMAALSANCLRLDDSFTTMDDRICSCPIVVPQNDDSAV